MQFHIFIIPLESKEIIIECFWGQYTEFNGASWPINFATGWSKYAFHTKTSKSNEQETMTLFNYE